MNKTVLWILCAVCAYLLGGVNSAIALSNLIYHEDIRTKGSKNPGFTNFKRVYGNRYAWYVFALDLGKTVLLCLLFCPLFQKAGFTFSLGAAYTGLCAMIGHVFPIWYGFHGGKGFLVGAAAIWFINWRAALIAFVVWGVLLAATKYMSLSVICAAASCPISLLFLRADFTVCLLRAAASLLMIVRHKENISRLIAGTESKFHLRGSH